MISTHSERAALLRLPSGERSRRLRRIMEEELTDLQRYTLECYYFHHMTLTQIAQSRSVNKSTVSRTLHRAEEKLRRFMRY